MTEEYHGLTCPECGARLDKGDIEPIAGKIYRCKKCGTVF